MWEIPKTDFIVTYISILLLLLLLLLWCFTPLLGHSHPNLTFQYGNIKFMFLVFV